MFLLEFFMTNKVAEAPKTESNQQPNYSPQVAFWKPYTKDNKPVGAVALFNYSEKTNRVFLEMRPQVPSTTEQNAFSREAGIVTMLGLPDLGEFLAVLRGRKGGLGNPDDKNGWKGLYHQNDTGSTSISMTATEKGYSLSIGAKKGAEAARRLGINLTFAEAEVLHDYLAEMLRNMF